MSSKWKKTALVVAPLALFAWALSTPSPSHAGNIVTLDINAPAPQQGGDLNGIGHLTVTFSDHYNASNVFDGVTMVITSHLTAGEFIGGKGQPGITLNIDPVITPPSNVTFTYAGSGANDIQADTVAGSTTDNGVKSVAAGKFDINYSIDPNRQELTTGETSTYFAKDTKDKGFSALSFNFPSTPAPGFYASAHIQNVTYQNLGSTDFVAGKGTVTFDGHQDGVVAPEPATIVMALTGLIPLAVGGRHRLRRRAA